MPGKRTLPDRSGCRDNKYLRGFRIALKQGQFRLYEAFNKLRKSAPTYERTLLGTTRAS
jgi:hypothetical protein